MKKNTKKKGSMRARLMMSSLVPLTIVVVVLFFVTTWIMISDLEGDMKDELHVAAQGLREYYEYDLINNNDPMHTTGVLDKLRRSNKECSIPKTALCLASLLVAVVVAVLIKLVLPN